MVSIFWINNIKFINLKEIIDIFSFSTQISNLVYRAVCLHSKKRKRVGVKNNPLPFKTHCSLKSDAESLIKDTIFFKACTLGAGKHISTDKRNGDHS